MKFCKDCFHHALVKPGDVHVCHRLEPAPSPVTGKPQIRYCEVERGTGVDHCGPDAVYFEAAEPF